MCRIYIKEHYFCI